jgi:phospholipase C
MIVVALLATTTVMSVPSAAGKTLTNKWSKIQHVIILMMENHAYDNYFGTYCQTTSSVCPNTSAGIPPGTCVPKNDMNYSQGCVKPFNFTAKNLTTVDLNHWPEAVRPAWNNGSMNGFYKAEGSTLTPFGTYNGTLVPTYWDMAQEFGLADHMFSSALSFSLPNHWYLIGASEPTVLQPLRKSLVVSNVPQHHVYLNESNNTSTVEQELALHPNVTWTYYDYPLASYQTEINNYTDSVGKTGAYNNWNPMAAQAQSYTPSNASHFVDNSQFYVDLRSGQLKNISWLIPDAGESDHPPGNITLGQNYVASVVNAVGASKYWNSTAIFVTWDEYGGFYDNVLPPVVDSVGDSFRVPLLVISPWTPAGFISHTNYSFDSLLAFVEWRWGLGCLGPRDCSANIPTAFFHFKIQRPPVKFERWANATYPYVPPKPGAPPFIEDPSLASSGNVPVTFTDG